MAWRWGAWLLGSLATIPIACGDDESPHGGGRSGASGAGMHAGGSSGAAGKAAGGSSGLGGSSGAPSDGQSGTAGFGGVLDDGSAGEATIGNGGDAGIDAGAGTAGMSDDAGIDASAGMAGTSDGGGIDASAGMAGTSSDAAIDASAGAAGVAGDAGVDASAGSGGLDAGSDADGGSAGPTWIEVPTTGDPLTPRRGHSAVVGPAETTIYVFGGQSYYRLSNELFAYDWRSGRVTLLPNTGSAPAERTNHVAVLDSVRNRMLVFGGRGHYDLYDDVYALDLAQAAGAWTRLAPAGTGPNAREGHVAAFDRVRNRLVIFGGRGYHDLYGDTWQLSFASGPDGTWSALSPSGQAPAARTEAAASYDSSSSRLFVGGGQGHYDVPRDVAVLDLSTLQGSWSLESPAPLPPDNGISGAWVWDGIAQRLFQYSGQAYYGLLNAPSTVDLGAGLPGTSVTQAPGLPELFDAALVYVPSGRTAVLIAGQSYHDLSGRIFHMNL